ncbi:hypothetical protein ScPMuIL_003684 [Solemya velum]
MYPRRKQHHGPAWSTDRDYFHTKELKKCGITRFTTGISKTTNNITFGNSLPGGRSNPSTFAMTSISGLLGIDVEVWTENTGSGADYKTADLQLNYTTRPSPNGAAASSLWNNFRISASNMWLDLGFRVWCDPSYYAGCSKNCTGDQYHYCDWNGDLVCNSSVGNCGSTPPPTTTQVPSTTILPTMVRPVVSLTTHIVPPSMVTPPSATLPQAPSIMTSTSATLPQATSTTVDKRSTHQIEVPGPNGPSDAVIAGSAVGAVLFLVLIVALILIMRDYIDKYMGKTTRVQPIKQVPPAFHGRNI